MDAEEETPDRPASLSSDTVGGGTVLQVDIDVSMAEMSAWSSDRIAAFFAGIACVRTAVHQGADLERIKGEWRAAQDDGCHLERCLEEIARTVGLDPEDPDYAGELWASRLTTAIIHVLTVGRR